MPGAHSSSHSSCHFSTCAMLGMTSPSISVGGVGGRGGLGGGVGGLGQVSRLSSPFVKNVRPVAGSVSLSHGAGLMPRALSTAATVLRDGAFLCALQAARTARSTAPAPRSLPAQAWGRYWARPVTFEAWPTLAPLEVEERAPAFARDDDVLLAAVHLPLVDAPFVQPRALAEQVPELRRGRSEARAV